MYNSPLSPLPPCVGRNEVRVEGLEVGAEKTNRQHLSPNTQHP